MSDDQRFEDLIRQTLEDFEVEFNPAHWQEMESRLNLLGQGVEVSMNTFYSAFVAAGIFMAGLIYFGLPDNHEGKSPENELLVEEALSGASDSSDGSRLINQAPQNEPKQNLDTFVIEVPEHAVEPLKEDDRDSAEDSETTIAESSKTPDENPKVKYDELKIKKIRSSVSQGCEGAPITFSTSGSESEGNFLWNFGDGYFSNDQNPVHVFDAPGIFDVSLLVTPLTGGKLTPMTIEDQIRINPRPKASFDYTYKQNPLGIPQVKFESHSKDVDQVMWVVNGNTFSEEEQPLHNFTRKGTYQIQLVAMNEFGCSDTTERKIVIKEDYNLHAPNTFSPNGDGRDDTFMPAALSLIEGSFILRIIDPRTDMVIFESTEINKSWDGTIAGTSVKASDGEYNWEVIVDYRTGNQDQFNGTIKLKK